MRPTGISANRTTRLLAIRWDNGMTVEYPFQLLADNCRCASCNEDRARATAEGRTHTAKSSELAAIEPVGSYAISILWQGGCRFGIYTWEHLLQLAPQVK